MQTGTVTVEGSMEIPQKIKNDLPFDLVISLLGIYPKEPKPLIRKNISTPMFIEALFAIILIWKRSKCPSIGKWIMVQESSGQDGGVRGNTWLPLTSKRRITTNLKTINN